MDTYTFHEGELPPDFVLDFEPALFNTSEFISLQSTTGWLSYHAVDTKSRKALATIRFHIHNDIAKSPLRAPFGSVECSDTINPQTLFKFLDFVENRLSHKGITEVYIKNPPRAYAPELIALLETFLLNRGFTVSDAEVGTVLPIASQSYEEIIRHSELLRRRQAQVAGLKSCRIPDSNLESLFGFIAACHKKKGYPLSISLGDLKTTVCKFPGRYVLFGVMEGDNLVAGSISILIRRNIMYNFLVNHDSGYSRLSPPVLLMDAIYKYCSEHSISMLDLGTSALQGKPNFSLLDFKLHVGGRSTSKLSFYKRIS